MTPEVEKHISYLFAAELQFRLSSTVRLTATLGKQPLDVPSVWTHGKHEVTFEEIALRQDQAEAAACWLQRSATYLMAVTMKDAIRSVVHDPKSDSNPDVSGAYQISRLIRNAFAHAPLSPKWSIDPDCCNRVFAVSDIIKLDTTGLQGQPFDWRHYGGPLALFHLCRFVRFEILKDTASTRKTIPIPKNVYYQQGDLILQKIDEIPAGAKRVDIETLPDGRIPLGEGHFLSFTMEEKSKSPT